MGKKRRKSTKKSPAKKGSETFKAQPKSTRNIPVIKILSITLPVIIIGMILYYTYPIFQNLLSNTVSQKTPAKTAERTILPPASDNNIKSKKIQFEDFAGSESCKECHEKEYNLWINSTHAKAGGEPKKVKIIAKFDGQPLYFKDAVVTPMVSAKGEYVFIVEQNGHPERILRVDAVVGGGHMYGGGTQSFFTKLPDGTLRFVPFDFIREENIWFVQLLDGGTWVPISTNIALNDLMQWTPHRMLGTQEGTSNCQNCHGSQILLEYFPEENRYRTRYRTLQINCESCHGPGKRHNELSKPESHMELSDLDMDALATFSKDQSLNVCFQCHAMKDALQDHYLPGDNFENYFSLKLPILGSDPYLPDGRVRSFAYQQNHIFSDCYVSGSMTCVDCHDPHTQQYRDVFGKPLIGRFDNGQCTGCHPSKAQQPELHSHHKPDSTGNLCTGCHMPFLQHRGLGQELVFARSDHVIPIPRPAFDAEMGIEDACTKCHRDKSIEWLQAKTEEWYGTLKPHNPIITDIMRSENINNIKTAAQLLLHPESNHTAGQITGLALFIKRFLRPDMGLLDDNIVEKLKTLSKSDDIDIKALSLMSLHFSRGKNPEIFSFLAEELHNLKGRENAVRYRWALAADYLGTFYASSGAFTNAITAHKKALEIRPNDTFTWMNLGFAYKQTGDYPEAISSFRKAAGIKPYDPSIHFQLAELHNRTGNRRGAIQSLKNVLKYDPNNQNARLILRRLEGFKR